MTAAAAASRLSQHARSRSMLIRFIPVCKFVSTPKYLLGLLIFISGLRCFLNILRISLSVNCNTETDHWGRVNYTQVVIIGC